MNPSTPTTSPDKSTGTNTPKKVVVLTNEVHGQLGKAAKKFEITNADFANAAIAYFTESGLDPRKTTKFSLAKVEQRVVEETYDVREHNAKIGNRLVGVIRTFERNIGLMIQQQQVGTFKYLEGIERNILGYLVDIEQTMLTTILERVVHGNVENYVNRIMLQILSLQLDEKRFPFSEDKLKELTAGYDKQRDRQIVVESQRIIAEKKAVRPRVTDRPAMVEILRAPTVAKPVPAAAETATEETKK